MRTKAQIAADNVYAGIAYAYGLRNVRVLFEEAREAGIGPALAAAIVEKETGGRNVVGHDRDSHGRLIFPAKAGTVYVTEALYRSYKRARGAHGQGGMQGMGPMQLTWWELQDAADKQGGCWVPRYNFRIGFRLLAALIETYGEFGGIKRYNGDGPAAEAYARDALAKRESWRKRLFKRR